MSTQTQNKTHQTDTTDANWRSLARLGGVFALMQLLCTVAIIVIVSTLGPNPTTAGEYFEVLGDNRLVGLLRTDIASLLVIALYLGTFPGLYAALRRASGPYAAFTTALVFVGVASCFATDATFSLLHLSDQYAAAASEAQRSQLLAAGEALLVSNIWNSSGGFMAGILLQGGGVLISIIMLQSRSSSFSRITAYAGLVANGFDLAQHLIHPVAPSLAGTLLMIAGPAYLVWFPMLSRDLFKAGRDVSNTDAAVQTNS